MRWAASVVLALVLCVALGACHTTPAHSKDTKAPTATSAVPLYPYPEPRPRVEKPDPPRDVPLEKLPIKPLQG